MPTYQRHLPHIQPEGAWLFLTWHLHGSLPAGRFPPPRNEFSAGQAFVWMDRFLDGAREGAQWLRNEEIARLVGNSIRYGAVMLRYYELGAYVVMPNHVHLLARPLVAAPVAMKGLKGVTARRANQILGRTGQPFWQHESYDHWVRDAGEWERIRQYIEANPVKAGLCASPAQWRWSSAACGDGLSSGGGRQD